MSLLPHLMDESLATIHIFDERSVEWTDRIVIARAFVVLHLNVRN